jgi:hypothetical protein
MSLTQRSRYATPLALLSVAGIGLWCWLLFRAGCTGDVKNGNEGDPVRAQELERFAAPFLLGGAAAGLASIGLLKHLPMAKRVLWGVRLVLFGLPIAWIVGVQFELLALRVCF